MHYPKGTTISAVLTSLSVAYVAVVGSGQQSQAAQRSSLPGLHHESIAFDASRNRIVVVFSAGDSLKGTWEWDGRGWTMAADSASSPTWRYGATMGYDPSSQRLLLFGGWVSNPRAPATFRTFCDTWAFDGRQWSRVADGPCVTTRVRNNALVYDSRRQAMLLADGTPELEGDTVRALRLWRWSGSGWTLLDSLGPRRSGWNRAAYDESRGVLVYPVFEGPDAGVWEWDGRVWKRVTAEGPSPRHVHGLQYDPRRRKVVLVGGQTFERPSRYLGDAWTWNGAQWTALTSGEGPSARAGGALLDDSSNGRLIYFGGYAGPPMRMATDLWFLTSSGWRSRGQTP